MRVSTNQQDVDNQRHGIFEYANQHSLGHLEFISDSVSGQKRWSDREAMPDLLIVFLSPTVCLN